MAVRTASVTVPIFVESCSAVTSPMLIALISVVREDVNGKLSITVFKENACENIRCKNTRVVMTELFVIIYKVFI